ncbi:hypothetical protein Naga_100053g9 [Nannochloropsis gaditana]|uniref:Uncharacterized protein n=1 Tax=Nannochloropsis gaditana TaxID=72520 RepID=W7TIK2_9STRA|nr:hypothetical protein Naga_100053g9 [Nannochloropsis gaditana]
MEEGGRLRGAWRAPGKRPPRLRVDGGWISGQRSARKSSGGTISVGEACTGRLLPEDVFRTQGSTSRGGQVGDLSRRGSHCCEWLRTGVSGLVREREARCAIVAKRRGQEKNVAVLYKRGGQSNT